MRKNEYNASLPIYLQLVERIQRQILRRERNPGDKLPSVREMAVESQVNPNTVQRTYSELERVGIVETRRGQGTFITEDKEKLENLRNELRNRQIGQFVEAMQEMGFSPREMVDGLLHYLNEEAGGEN
ncbi:GntR family transcriptional regulator [Desmospora profundinema]|uniref:GntR family transcriptional regulator n=1 Tax=Desmospora profundinema TaxID=1571184 RepID=A0ABU1IKJ4_9BACL|nr:GntR family transcriptional regulator [Desmospora profundinema]MDR6225300.1 GntR family transcriptional regulator [Desmospora profundinema]